VQFSQFQKLRNLDLDLGSGRSYWCAYPVEVYPHIKLYQNRKKKNFLRTDGRTYTVKSEWTDFHYFVFGSASLLYIKCVGTVRSF